MKVKGLNDCCHNKIHNLVINEIFHLNILKINSCLICNGDNDRGNLIVFISDIYNVLRNANPDYSTIILMHHELAMFLPEDRKKLEEVFKSFNVKLILCGDAHRRWSRKINSVIEVTAGSLKSDDFIDSNINIGSILNDNSEIISHKWDVGMRRWSVDSAFNDMIKEELGQNSLLKKNNKTNQIQGIEEFIENHLTKDLTGTLNTTFLFRDEELRKIDDLFTKNQIIILTGKSGCGKTKLAVEYVRKVSNYIKIVISSKFLSIEDDLLNFFESDKNYFVIIDDANELSELKGILRHITENSNNKILLTVRNYAKNTLYDALSNIYNFDNYDILSLPNNEIKEVITNTFKITDKKILDHIVYLSNNNNRFAILISQHISLFKDLSNIKNLNHIYEIYYSNIIRNEVVMNEINFRVLSVISVMKFINISDFHGIENILDLYQIPIKDVKQSCFELHNLEILDIYQDRMVVINDQALSDFILKRSLYDIKITTISSLILEMYEKDREKLLHSIKTILHIFTSEDNNIYEYVVDEVEISFNFILINQKCLLLKFLCDFAYLIPNHAIEYIYTLILDEKTTELDIDKLNKNRTIININDDIIIILCQLMNTEHKEAAIDLLIEHFLKKPELYTEFYKVITQRIGYSDNDLSFIFDPHKMIIERLLFKSDHFSNKIIMELIFDLIDYFIKIEYSYSSNSIYNKHTITFNQFQLNANDNILNFRGFLWNILKSIAKIQHYNEKIVNLLFKYSGINFSDSIEILKYDISYIDEIFNIIYKKNEIHVIAITRNLSLFMRIHGIEIPSKISSIIESERFIIYNFIMYDYTMYYKEYRNKSYEKYENFRKQEIKKFKKDLSIEKIKQIIDYYNDFAHYIKEKYDDYDVLNSILNDKSISNFSENIIDYIILKDLGVELSINELVEELIKNKGNKYSYNYLCKIPEEKKFNYLWSYFSLISSDLDELDLENLYTFFKSEVDKYINKFYNKNILMVKKFDFIDGNVLVNCIRIIFEKKDYSILVVSMYLQSIFLDKNNLKTVFIDNYDLMFNVYIILNEYHGYFDYNGQILKEMYSIDNTIKDKVKQIIKSNFVEKEIKDITVYIDFIWNCSDGYKDIDQIVDYALEIRNNKSLYSFNFYDVIVKYLLLNTNIRTYDKIDSWIKYFISINYEDLDKMLLVCYYALKRDNETKVKLYLLLLEKNLEFDFFNKLPLISSSYSWSGSAIPTFENFYKFYELLELSLSGLKYLEHKRKLSKLMKSMKERIKNEELKEIQEDIL